MFGLVLPLLRGPSIERLTTLAVEKGAAGVVLVRLRSRCTGMRKHPALAVLILFGIGGLRVGSAQAQPGPSLENKVTAVDGFITIPTYEHTGRELQPPLFAGSALVGLYPFPTYKMPLKTPPEPKRYKAIFVENEYLKLTYVPYFGGRFLSLYDKLRKREVFYKNDVIKPTQFNARGDC
jgi:hypothetical protein